jgi:hypothetical protein
VCRSRECADDARHQRIASFGALIGINVGAQRDRLTAPRFPMYLAAEHVGDVRLDDDLGVESLPQFKSRYSWAGRAKQ